MKNHASEQDPRAVKVLPLSQRTSLCRVEDLLVNPDSPAPPCSEVCMTQARSCAAQIREARDKRAAVILIYGAHLLRNGAALLLDRMMDRGWITHLATNGAGSIHDWEFAFLGRSTEGVRENVATGTFGAWDETGRYIHLALMAGALQDEGYGQALGRFISEDGVSLPSADSLRSALASSPDSPRSPAWAELLVAMRRHQLSEGRLQVRHPWKHASIFASAWRHQIPLTVHPGIGYDIVSVHPMFNGAVLGRAATLDFHRFVGSVDGLDHGVVLSIGSAIMGPQVFEKSLSCVNNVRLQAGRQTIHGHAIYVVDIQEGGHWDWSQGEPPKAHPAYYLRFCKSYSRMGAPMHYVHCDNLVFLHNLYCCLMNR